ncbi:MAG TPA: hypothetical protein VMN36_11950 [Verrucomicrobiales bacterium]|nr:hypothetical protein [Verrucomicrobiales bacterium]
MRIHDINKTEEGDSVQASATAAWEDSDRPQQRIYVETHARFAGDLNCNPNAFLLAAILPAMRHGERRVLVDGKVCPDLRNGLVTAMQLLCSWYGDAYHRPPMIEATQGFGPVSQRPPLRTGSFLSGGIDALATLRANRSDFPSDHPASIQDCFFIDGLDVGGYESMDRNTENSALAAASLSNLATRAKATLIPVSTNMRHLDDDDFYFYREAYGAALAVVAHCFSKRITAAMIAASSSTNDLRPIGSHPLLDPCYSSFDVDILHDGIRFSRLAKAGIVSEWDDALQTIRSCFDPFRPAHTLNCGKCEKCVRTMTALVVYDKLKHASAFPLDDVTPELLQTIIVDPIPALKAIGGADAALVRKARLGVFSRSLTAGNVDFWREMIEPLAKRGRTGLAKGIEDMLSEYANALARAKRTAAAKQFERKYLGGALSKVYRFARGR